MNTEPVRLATPCGCCHATFGKGTRYKGVERTVCDKCLGFFIRWTMDIFEQNKETKLNT